MEVSSVIYKTPIGPLKLEATAEGICAVKWLFGKHSKSKSDSADHEQPSTPIKEAGESDDDTKAVAVPVGASCRADEHLEVCKTWLDAYFAGTLLESNPPKPALVLPESGTAFFHSVWSTLASTGVGETMSYKELAKLSGKPNAARAAGQALKKHCLPILVPCHRVVKSGRGSTKGQCLDAGEYSGGEGPATKEWLLQHEKKMLQGSQ